MHPRTTLIWTKDSPAHSASVAILGTGKKGIVTLILSSEAALGGQYKSTATRVENCIALPAETKSPEVIVMSKYRLKSAERIETANRQSRYYLHEEYIRSAQTSNFQYWCCRFQTKPRTPWALVYGFDYRAPILYIAFRTRWRIKADPNEFCALGRDGGLAAVHRAFCWEGNQRPRTNGAKLAKRGWYRP